MVGENESKSREERRMYKSQLQELCQKEAWSLPEYNTTKQGEDHNPRFQSTVIVNGKSFHSQNPARSSKQAQNEAAHLAYLHFTSPYPGSPNATADLTILEPGSPEASRNSQFNETASVCKDNDRFKDTEHLYKNLLQTFAQKRNLSLPVYSCEFEGPPHAGRFRCKVTVNNQTYESLQFFRTMKEAEHAAAKIALSSLSPDTFQEEDFSFYKNLLQELTQKEGCPLPVYTTTRSGQAHASNFVSVVEVKGEVYTGQEAKTKKQAELLAAKVAYMKLKECKSKRDSMIITPAGKERDVHVISSSHLPSNVNAVTQQDVRHKACTLTNPSSTSGRDLRGDKVNGTFCNNYLCNAFPQPEVIEDWQSSSSSSTMSDPPPMINDHSAYNFPSNRSATTNLVMDAITRHPFPTSALSCDRVVVHPHVPGMKFPAGSTVLPASDDNWVAIRLGSRPNQ